MVNLLFNWSYLIGVVCNVSTSFDKLDVATKVMELQREWLLGDVTTL